MQQLHETAIFHGHQTRMVLPQGDSPMFHEMRVERLPFTVKIAQDEEALLRAVKIRQSAYGRHVPGLAERLGEPESCDHDAGTVVLLAESKLDGTALGTMRIQTNSYHPLGVEQSVDLPDWLRHRSLAEATRLGVASGGIGRVVKTVLFKAFYQYCLEAHIDWMVITARSPLDKQYEALLFQDVFRDGTFIPMHHVGDIPHRVMAFEVGTAEARWQAANHPLLNFMCHVRHPDVKIDLPMVDGLPESVKLTDFAQRIDVQ